MTKQVIVAKQKNIRRQSQPRLNLFVEIEKSLKRFKGTSRKIKYTIEY